MQIKPLAIALYDVEMSGFSLGASKRAGRVGQALTNSRDDAILPVFCPTSQTALRRAYPCPAQIPVPCKSLF
ncbi:MULTISPECIES: hypothetical protein [unclassified Bradyrhizobium]|uniref:hypothetical protein n=1 Tax=unclassified Bradyrhizobium TaxID=2631580 RepID=UPI001FFAA9FD|nr:MULTISPECIES: hypothetical protein [unclassified Bradyrhizobium]MCK1707857.1 hypothetical protein [Bradyrhizobium sp. 143]MCK1731443.1 hypothetical protein [Bradyrhizobium sp. 142]